MNFPGRLLREPLLHFLLIGVSIFAAYRWFGDEQPPARDRIVVSEARVENLAALFQRTWQRPPTADELDNLVADYVREEVLYREAVAMGLDRDDTVIRRRLRQKMEFIVEDMTAAEDPGDEVLNQYLSEHAERYRVPPVYTFNQVYLSRDRRGDSLSREARELLEQLREGVVDPAEAGDPTMLDHRFKNLDGPSIARIFGERFSAELAGIPVGAWEGPVVSGFGAHLVRIETRTEARQPALDEIRAVVRRDWDHERREQARDAFVDALLERYDVVIETSQDPSGRDVQPAVTSE